MKIIGQKVWTIHSNKYVSIYPLTHSQYEAKAWKTTTGETAQLFIFMVGNIPGEDLSFLGCLSIFIISIFWKHSMSRSKMVSSPQVFLELAFWSCGTEVQDQTHMAACPLVTRPGQEQERVRLFVRSSFTGDMTICHPTMCHFFVFPKSVGEICLLWLYFQAFEQVVTNINNFIKCISKNGHLVQLKMFLSLIKSLWLKQLYLYMLLSHEYKFNPCSDTWSKMVNMGRNEVAFLFFFF